MTPTYAPNSQNITKIAPTRTPNPVGQTRHVTRAKGRHAQALNYGKSGDPAKTTYSRIAFSSRPSSFVCQSQNRGDTSAHAALRQRVHGEVMSCDGSTGMGRAAARAAGRKAQGSGAGAAHLHGVDDDREEEEAPAGASARSGLEPESHHQLQPAPCSLRAAGRMLHSADVR